MDDNLIHFFRPINPAPPLLLPLFPENADRRLVRPRPRPPPPPPIVIRRGDRPPSPSGEMAEGPLDSLSPRSSLRKTFVN